MPSFSYKYSDTPDPEGYPKDFNDLLSIGKKNAEIEIFDRKWSIYTIEEWEEREIVKKLINLDLISRSSLRRIEVLTCAIMDCTDLNTGKQFTFKSASEKPTLRNILLLMDPKVIDEMYGAYRVLEESARREFREKYGSALEKIRNDFFGHGGGQCGHSDSKTQKTQSSKK